jgi:transposase
MHQLCPSSRAACGATLTAEFLAVTGGIDRFRTGDRLAAAAGLAPILKQSGKVRYLQRATTGDKALKHVFYQSAFIAIACDPASKAYYRRKRSHGRTHHQAVLALARRASTCCTPCSATAPNTNSDSPPRLLDRRIREPPATEPYVIRGG